MAQTKQTTMNVDGEKFVLKARRLSTGVGCIRYAVSVNDWKTKVGVRLTDLDAPSVDGMIDQALWLALEKGLAKWLKSWANE